MAKAKPKAGPKAPLSKVDVLKRGPKAPLIRVDVLKRKLNDVPAAIQPLAQAVWRARDGLRDEQRQLVQNACNDALTVAHAYVDDRLLEDIQKLDEAHPEWRAALDAVRNAMSVLKPPELDALPAELRGLAALNQRIEYAVDGVDDDIESFIDYVCDPDLCPKEEDVPPLEHLQIALAECDNETIGQELAGSFDNLRSLDAEVLLREFIHRLSPQHRCIIAAILAAS
jgi:hypothetical protein